MKVKSKMACRSPILRVFYRDRSTGKMFSKTAPYSGEPLEEVRNWYRANPLLVDKKKGLIADYVKLALTPCGHCVMCRASQRREWTSRLILENKTQSKKNFTGYFITLTYSEEYLPSDGNLHKKDFQKFMKRFRISLERKFNIKGLRFFACGEYGEHFQRPHFHLILWLPDSTLDSVQKFIESSWPFGFVQVDFATVDRFAYVAGYVSKKLVDGRTVGKAPEFILMSRRPGIGTGYSLEEIRKTGKLYLPDGQKVVPPRYYKNKLTEDEKEQLRIRGSPVDNLYNAFIQSGKTWSQFHEDEYQKAIDRYKLNKFNSRKGKSRI